MYYLAVNLLSGSTSIQRKLPILSAKHNYPGIEISIEEIKQEDPEIKEDPKA